MSKICCVCNTDVSGKKRVKDPQGNYYCEPCYNAKTAEKKPQPVAVAASAPDLDLAPTPAPALNDMGMLDLAEGVKDQGSVDTAMFGCADCKKLVPEKQIRNDDGEFVCNTCFGRRKMVKPNTAAAAPRIKTKKELELEDDPNKETFFDTFTGGLLISGCVVAFAWIIFFCMNMFMQGVGRNPFPPTVLLSGVVATFETVFMIFMAFALICSMVVAARIMGGCDFGYLGAAIWKSLVVMLVFSVVNSFIGFSLGIFFGFGFRGAILVLAFIVVFKLDYFEAVILAIVNFFVLLGMFIGMAILMTSLLAALAPHQAHNVPAPPPGLRNPQPANVPPPPAAPDAGDPAPAAPPDGGQIEKPAADNPPALPDAVPAPQ